MIKSLLAKRVKISAQRVKANGNPKSFEQKVLDVDRMVQKKGWRVRYACNFAGIPQTAYFRFKRKQRSEL